MSWHRNFTLFVALAALWGVAFMAIKAGLAFFPPVLFAAIRYDIAAVIMILYAAYVTDNWIPRTRSDWTAATVDGLFLVGAYNVFVFLGELHVTSAVAAIIVSLNPVLSTVFSRVILPDERLTVLGLFGLLVGFGGVGLVSNPDLANLFTGDTLGKLLMLLAAASFAFGSVFVQLIDDELSTEGTTGWACLVGAVMLHATSLGLGESFGSIEWTVQGITALAYLVVGSSAVGYFIYFDLLDRLGPIEINLVSYVAPVFAAVSGWLVLDEQIGSVTIGGFVLIFVGFVLIKREAIAEEFPRMQRSVERIR
ncbi:DMT family transporter [Halorussus ruber]|uniref:DMT family transporter n=1 Tax=Halorussus ruber TaxID=1126238 RepID=UPI00109251B0|nr:EamA family transporter [Halorussus ruber]